MVLSGVQLTYFHLLTCSTIYSLAQRCSRESIFFFVLHSKFYILLSAWPARRQTSAGDIIPNYSFVSNKNMILL